MTPPEVVLDRWIKTQLQGHSSFSHYLGKLDIESVPSPFRWFLSAFQKSMNEALRLENVNASGGVDHPPFHFDYIDVDTQVGLRNTKNALAFQHDGFSFIAVTFPLIESVFEVSRHLSISTVVQEILSLNSSRIEPDQLQALLFQIQLSFLTCHEYTHHIHRHGVGLGSEIAGLWVEFREDSLCGNLNSQAQELDADGYAVYLVLAHLLRGEMRQTALAGLGRTDLPEADGDEMLLTCFFLSVLSFFCTFWSGRIDEGSIYELTHPPPPVRIKYVINVAQMWCGQNGCVPDSWFSPARLKRIFGAAATDIISMTTGETWDAQMSFLRSAAGDKYDRLLFSKFEDLRKRKSPR